jgi:Outer membrane protein beta-barrel family/CarboxypepD_reg-like domain
MRKLTSAFFVMLVLNLSSYGQISISGNVKDTTEKKSIVHATVLLLQQKDSIMVRFTRTDQNGHFILKNIPKGKFLLLTSYPKYADFVDELEVKDSSDIQLPAISMILKSQLLQEVVVTGNKAAIRIKGDTTEFKADSFKVQQGATVEELLKKLPGIQVDKNGKITAQGETVQKVLVDGEEFFGDDPTLVTQNLRADMVDKVQVYDKKSDQANFTGIDDGQKTKTINLQLKDDKKNGYFGKLEAGVGTDGYYNYQAMVNFFKKKKKISAYGIASNTGKTGLNWQENGSYGQSFANNVDYDENMGYFTWSGNQQEDDLDSWSGQYDGQGYPKVLTAGVHFNDKWSEDRQSINGNYKILQLNVNGNTETNTKTILPDTLYFNNEKKAFNNQILRNRLSGIYEYHFDSTSSIKVNADGGTDHKITNNQYTTEARAIDSALVNQTNRTTSTIGDVNTLNTNLIWRKKLKKRGRTISFNLSEVYKGSSSDGSLYAENDFYSGGTSPKQIIDQHKNFINKNLQLDSRITYSEPLSKSSSLLVNYGISIDNSNSNRSSYSKDVDGKYTVLDSIYSNDYLFNVFTQKAGLNYSLIKKKFRINAGSDIGFTNFKQDDVPNQLVTKRDFINWYPRANMTYSFTRQSSLRLNYNGNTTQPTIQQIQPIANNDDPLNIAVGNPNLKPQFANNIRLSFNDYNELSQRYIYTSVSASFTEDAISSKDYIDTVGRRVLQAVNVNGNYNINAYLGYGFKWKKPGINIDFGPNFNTSRNVSIINNVTNVTNSGNYSLQLNLNKFKEKKYGIGLSGNATYSQSISSIQVGIKTTYWTYNIRPDIDFFLPLKFQIHTDCDINIRPKSTTFPSNNTVAFWNAWIGKKFTKNDALLLKASVNDLLNMNIGFNRNVSSNYISQTTYSTIQRYFMLSLVWNFTKAGTPMPKND